MNACEYNLNMITKCILKVSTKTLVLRFRCPDREHLCKDLTPYICTFASCMTPLRMFSTEEDWFCHEVTFHRRQWKCPRCEWAFALLYQFTNHIIQTHGDLLEDGN